MDLDTTSNYTGEGKGGPDPSEGISVFQTSIPSLNTYITYFLHKKFLIYLLYYLYMKKHQVKSCYYYLFWGIATISVLFGQLYVGSGYRYMADSIEELTQEIDKAF